MWLLNWFPNWIFYSILFAGLLGLGSTYLLKFVPFVYIYRQTIQLASVGAIIIGTFMSGAIYDNEAWVARVKEMESKVAKAEEQAKEATAKIDEKLETNITQRVEKQIVINKYIDREIIKYNEVCTIPTEFIQIINKATEK